MFCTSKERETCNVEKMTCEGCYYNKDGDYMNEKEIKKLRCIHLADKRDNEKLCNAIEEVKFLNTVIDMMAKDLVKVPTNDYMSETQQEIARYMNRHLKEKKGDN